MICITLPSGVDLGSPLKPLPFTSNAVCLQILVFTYHRTSMVIFSKSLAVLASFMTSMQHIILCSDIYCIWRCHLNRLLLWGHSKPHRPAVALYCISDGLDYLTLKVYNFLLYARVMATSPLVFLGNLFPALSAVIRQCLLISYWNLFSDSK